MRSMIAMVHRVCRCEVAVGALCGGCSGPEVFVIELDGPLVVVVVVLGRLAWIRKKGGGVCWDNADV
eukprot:4705163-Prorocentrum_lima.AAC.1